MSLLPRFVDSEPDEPRVLDVEDPEADRAFDALGSETARAILSEVYQEPATPTEIRESVGTSLQNVHYHLDSLEEANLIEPAGTGYSETGNEMTVYGPTSEAFVLFAGREHARSRLRDVLSRALGLFVLLGLATIALAAVVEFLLPPAYATRSGGDGGAGGGDGVSIAAESAEPAASSGGPAVGMEPVVAFFLGGCFVLVGLTVWWYLREVRPVR